MKTPAIALLLLLNVVLLATTHSLSSSVRRVSERRLDAAQALLVAERDALARERLRIAAQRARLEDRLSLLAGVAGLRLDGRHGDTESRDGAGDAADGADPAAWWDEARVDPVHEKPDPLAIELLDEQELQEIRRYREQAMPPRPSEGVLLTGDVDAVLGDPDWNPESVSLSREKRAELARLMSDYRYFSRVSLMERHRMVQPEVARLREVGAYVEYPSDDPPAAPGELAMSHAEPSDREGYRRMYYFFAEDYPDVYHQSRVEQEQALRVFVDIHRLIHESPGSGG